MDEDTLITETWRVAGMTCVNCQNTIGRALRETPGVQRARVSYNDGIARVSFDLAVVGAAEVARVIEDAGYTVVDAEEKAVGAGATSAPDLIGLLLVVVALFLLIQHFGLTRFFSSVPLASASMSYGALLLMGLATSLHCVAMCGGIQLSQTMTRTAAGMQGTTMGTTDTAGTTSATDTTGAAGKDRPPYKSKGSQFGMSLAPAALYNLGRVASYTAVGAVVGALGSVVSFSGAAKGVVQIVAGVFMLIMGLNMLGVAPRFLRKLTPRMPAAFTRSLQNGTTNATRRGGRLTAPLIVGLLNGLMPCGPLQAMQIFALSTGSPLNGAAAMFFFALGTVPLMFTLGAVSSWMSKKFTRTVLQIGSVVVAVFGLVMLTTGLSLSGVRLPGAIAGATTGTGELARIEGSGATAVQTVTTTLASGRYQPITVQVGIPVRWTVTATDADINGCNGSIIIPAYNVEHDFHPGDNLIEFTPDRPGTYVYTCWMGMISSTITVLDENGREVKGSEDAQTNLPDATGAAVAGAAGCPCCDGAAGTAE